MEELRSHLAELGYTIPAEKFILNGSLQRFPRNGSKDSGWFIGWIHNYIKRPGQYTIASFGDWRTGEEHFFVPGNIGGAEKKLAGEVIEASKRKLAVQKDILQKEASIKAKSRFEKAYADGLTPYLVRKQIDSLYGSRHSGNTLIIPMQDITGEILGSQRILPDGQKFFEKGQKTDGGFFVIGNLIDDVIICEGFATGCSIHMATHRNVVIAFNAGNLVKVAKAIKMALPDISITIAGDDDRTKTPNVGREKAEKAGLIAMAPVIFPASSGTDFNDLHCEYGLDKVREQLEIKKDAIAGFKPLGYDDAGHYFFNIEFKDIFRISNFTPQNLFLLAPEQYWNETYRPTDGKTNWQRAANDLITMSLSKGRFNPGIARGAGVWLDRGRVVVNMGDSLIVQGAMRSLYWPEGESVYVQSSHRIPRLRRMATVEECNALLDACDLLSWRDEKSAHLLAGWIAIARIAGALEIRPHVWLTGGSATGKTTIMAGIIEPSLGGREGIMLVQGGTTEAGIRQSLRASSMPLIFDEFESTTKITKERYEAIIELLRNTWAATNGQIVKGSAGGTTSSFNLTFPALVSSVGVNLLTDADKSRFSILELKPHGDDNLQWDRLKKTMQHIDEEFGHRLFTRMVSMLPIVMQNFQILRSEIARVSRQRMGQQVGMLMAGWYALRSDEVITREGAASIAEDMNLKTENSERQTEEEACFNHLMTTVVRLDESHAGVSKPIWRLLCTEGEPNENRIKEELKKFGIVAENDAIFVASDHAFLQRLFEHTKWLNWGNFLQRLEGATVVPKKRFGPGYRCKAIKIPIQLIKIE